MKETHSFTILGASGFIGRHLTQKLASQGHAVFCFSRTEIKQKHPGAIYQVVSDYTKIDFPKNSLVYHLAETHHIKEVEEKGAQYIKEVTTLVESLFKKKPKKFIYASSTAVYLDNKTAVNTPEQTLFSDKTIYAQAKLAVEQIVIQHQGLVARITNTFGQGMSNLNIFADILNQLQNDVIKLREATPIRDYIWIGDVVTALEQMGLMYKPGIYNIATGYSISCIALCKMILKISKKENKKIEFIYPNRTSTINLSIEKTLKTFSWRPLHDLEASIKKLLSERYDL